ncbi:MAG: 1-acyl-sn-glycerol-3-phosphate acyltransferase, partial [Phaeodactylibacter sp.]|nr:1-acyl-sn-glycerol-3-phosphate acyltransferase [Phaeodactylibacter sp.]
MLYPITRPLAKLTLSLFFRELYFSHAERIPKDKAVILAANHPTAFLEPCILACWLEMPIYFMVRGDIFSKHWANRILRDLHMIPVFRKKDGGLKQVRQNHQSLDEATRVLCKKSPLLVMAEGGTNGERRLKPLQKGVARLALKTHHEFPELDV